MRVKIVALVGIVGVVMLGGVVAGRSSDNVGRLYLDDQTIAQGAQIYANQCASCHGADLEGEPDWTERDAAGYLPAPPHDATGHTWHHPTQQLFEITKYGTEALVGGDYRSNMIGFGDMLSDEEILAVLAFIKSTWPRQIIQRHNALDESYRAAN